LPTEDRSTRYHRLRRRADLGGTAAGGLALVWLIASGGARAFGRWAASAAPPAPGGLQHAVAVGLVTIGVLLLLSLIELPFAFYQGFYLEHRYGLSRESFRHWVVDQLKGAVVSLVLAVAGASVVFGALRSFPSLWWLLSAVLFTAAIAGLTALAPVVLLPLFYEFKSLDRPDLASRLMALMTRAGTQVVGVFEWVLSGHTKKASAALAGLGRTRRILLSDTLLADYSDDEIEVILAHELAHHVHHDLWRGILLQGFLVVVGFYVAHVVLGHAAGPLGLSGRSDPAALPLLLLVGGGWALLTLPIANALSRARERAADRYALDATGNIEAFVTAMKRLAQQNLAEENPSPVVRVLFHSHPPIRERIAAARAGK
jgi:STE24 endopeptidase